MSRGDSGYIRPGYDPLEVPDAPTIGSATAGDTQVDVSFTPPTNEGGSAITGYGAVAIKTSDGTTIAAIGSSSPVTVTGLTNGENYTATVWALNIYGPSPYSAATGSFSPQGILGLFAGGTTSSGTINTIQYIIISTTGNTSDWGDLTVSRQAPGGCGSSTRGVFQGGMDSSANETNVIDYITYSSSGNAIDFGDYNNLLNVKAPACSNDTRGLLGQNIYYTYITIASTGNSTDFGTNNGGRSTSACSNTTRGIFFGGSGSTDNNIQYFTIASTGNSTDFGDLTVGGAEFGSASNSTRGVTAGGSNRLNVIDYITTASTGNATDFGDLTVGRAAGLGAVASPTRCVFAGGTDSGTRTNIMDYITTASTGNATDFGDMIQATSLVRGGCSNGHGGLA